MERQNNSKRNHESEIVKSARFIDTLPSEVEAQWNLLTETAESQESSLEMYGEIWENHELPQVFRDRALIRYMSHDALQIPPKHEHATYQKGQLISPIYHHNLQGTRYNGYFHPDYMEIADWLKELHRYQKDNSVELVPESARLLWTYVLFDKVHYDKQEFDEILETFIPQEVSPTFQNFGIIEGETNLIPGNLYDRFSYLDHIIRMETATPEMTRLRDWAVEKLHFWLNNYNDVDALSAWMKDIDREKALPLVQEVLHLSHLPGTRRKLLETPLSPNTFRYARMLYDWDEIFDSTVFNHKTSDRWLIVSVLRRLNGEQDLEEDLLNFIMSSGLSFRGDGYDDVLYVRKVAHRIGNQKLIDKVMDKTRDSKKGKSYEFKSAYEIIVDKSITNLESELEATDQKYQELTRELQRKTAYKGLLKMLQYADKTTSELAQIEADEAKRLEDERVQEEKEKEITERQFRKAWNEYFGITPINE